MDDESDKFDSDNLELEEKVFGPLSDESNSVSESSVEEGSSGERDSEPRK